MRYLLDTSTCVAVLRGKGSVGQRLSEKAPSDTAVSAMTVAELWHGVLRSRDPARTGVEVRAFLSPIDVLPFDQSEAYAHARIRRDLEERGVPIGERDLVIASTAWVKELIVVTNNTREFRRIAGLGVEDWSVT